MTPDPELQQRILERLRDANPRPLFPHDFSDTDDAALGVTAKYLADHGLMTAKFHNTPSGIVAIHMQITGRGLDHLSADGGLSAELGVVTIRLHEDSLKALIEDRVKQAGLDPEEQHQWIAALRSLPAASTKHLALKLIDAALAQAPSALHIIRTALGF